MKCIRNLNKYFLRFLFVRLALSYKSEAPGEKPYQFGFLFPVPWSWDASLKYATYYKIKELKHGE